MSRRTVAGLFCLALGQAATALAQTSLGGFAEYDQITYFEVVDEDKVNGRNAGTVQLELDHSANGTAAIFSAVELRVDLADPSRNRVFLDEAYVDLYVGSFDIRVGKQIYAWGKADGLNPTDNLAVWDYSDVLDTEDERIGQVSIRADYYVDETTGSLEEYSFPPSRLAFSRKPTHGGSRYLLMAPLRSRYRTPCSPTKGSRAFSTP